MARARDLAIQQSEDAGVGRFFAALSDGEQAELSYRWRPDGAMVIEHTGVPTAYRGQGIALALVEAVIEEARRNGYRIVPLCPYVRTQFERHPDWADLHA